MFQEEKINTFFFLFLIFLYIENLFLIPIHIKVGIINKFFCHRQNLFEKKA